MHLVQQDKKGISPYSHKQRGKLLLEPYRQLRGPSSRCKWTGHAGPALHAAGTSRTIFLTDESGRAPIPSETDLPMLHKRVMVTAPRQYAHKLAGKLLLAGARPVWVPSVAINPVPQEKLARLDAALRALITDPLHHPYTHIAFTSKNGIYATLQRAAELCEDLQQGHASGLDGSWLDVAVQAILKSGVKLCALGADGDVLLNARLPVHVSPTEASTQGLVRELKALDEAQGAHILCPVPLVASPLVEPKVVPRFLAALSEAGAHAERVEAYETSAGCNSSACALEMDALKAGHIDAIAFSSTAEAQGLKGIYGEGLKDVLLRHNVILAAHGPYTRDGVQEVLDVPVSVVSHNFKTFEGLVLALEEAFRKQQEYEGLGLKLG
uniref:Tetrapyrrole biosynthesis uroporphyrinogen III synthase domain-containing protein n=1 Tax=Dunaliella tertiolecta TaxID=3047 RepID=A0A6S8HNF3_DUNTE|mmetsp:Transcript_510/g.1323  ORF Transcript_510/g.1323 Transcript_510/m.1323 type:complete len:382 (+) Transcript_510:27-1172(+)|eukprot:CAMPEP_0202382056 /NCGR_PEP_ID=MMETSP1127-20130417/40726_1 /ASSEMBLY_ACC=CAM_ASM_000462 /TAXON_ID=3047 /ORGANISM="Dunaliella tertiolecta, Strain CCMP1320" /LENGTH=381 /DNA_ID=CAMNT_0048981165 /DNA_START=1552 /DNA_END=2697 /DNA_ORIENTATION=-